MKQALWFFGVVIFVVSLAQPAFASGCGNATARNADTRRTPMPVGSTTGSSGSSANAGSSSASGAMPAGTRR